MAKLNKPFDPIIGRIVDELHRGNREDAKAWLAEWVASGKAGSEAVELERYLATAPRGRQRFGARHLWIDIGQDNDEMREAGASYEDRLAELGRKYRLTERHVKTALAIYERGTAAKRDIDEENR